MSSIMFEIKLPFLLGYTESSRKGSTRETLNDKPKGLFFRLDLDYFQSYPHIYTFYY